MGVIFDSHLSKLILCCAVFSHVQLSGQGKRRWRGESKTGFPVTVYPSSHVENGLAHIGQIQLLNPKHHHKIGQTGGNKRIGIAYPYAATSAHMFGPGRELARLNAQRFRGKRSNMTLKGRSLWQDGTHDQSFDILGCQLWNRGKAGLTSLSKQFPKARFSYPKA